jgi:hypothetical protein
MKYDGRGSHKRAILHMIGQYVNVFNEHATVKDVASWMNVSKATALKHLKMMRENEEINMFKRDYKNTFMWEIDLQIDTFREYAQGQFEAEYKIYAQQVLKVILQ